MNNILRIVLHIAVFVIAGFIFFVGLGVGLALNPNLGTALWILAGLMALGNCLWIVRRGRSRDAKTN